MSVMESVLPLLETHLPSSAEDAARIVRDAAESNTPLYTAGGETALNYGGRPTREGIGLSLKNLSSLVDYPTRDLTITVEAGIRVAELAAITAKEGQRLPVDIPQASAATVGGAIATAAAGARRFSCGTLRDYVLGLEVIDGTGNRFATGGRVVKNAAGYDLSRLITGSLGSLGVITQVTLMVKPIPEIWGFHVCRTTQPGRVLESLAKTRVLPAAIELLLGPDWNEVPGLEGNSNLPAVVVGFEGPEAEVGWMLDTIEEEWAGVGETHGVNILGADADALWGRLCEFPATEDQPDKLREPPVAEDGNASSVVVEIAVLPHRVAALTEHISTGADTCSLQTHAGNGIIRVKQGVSDDAQTRQFVQQMRELAGEYGGRATALSVPYDVALTPEEAWGPLGSGFPVMQALKQRFDPKGILNPGRTVY